LSSTRAQTDTAQFPLNPAFLNLTPADKKYLLIVSGFTMGLLPLLQAHSFFGVGIVTVVVALMEVPLLPPSRS
jgi:hypothetical protein